MVAVFLAEQPGRVGDTIVVDGAEGHHGAAVRRLAVGEHVQLVDGRGTRSAASVLSVARDAFSVQVLQVQHEPAPQPRLVVVQALLKGDAAERAVGMLTEVGADEIVPWAASRCVVRWEGPRAERGLRRWRAAAREAAKQSRRAWLPDVTAPLDLAGLVSAVRAGPAFVLHEAAAQPLAGAVADLPVDAAQLLVVVGPEGGITDDEVDALAAAGARTVRLGPTVLRGATAGTVAAGVLLAATPRWR
jgi:16S rRNA (uracil1498-N3)-methyltransferase